MSKAWEEACRREREELVRMASKNDPSIDVGMVYAKKDNMVHMNEDQQVMSEVDKDVAEMKRKQL